MGKINLLSKSVSELIAAGEVVERPASVIKETVENSIDAGAKRITVEIKRGGISFMRITDDGCGIEKDDVPLAFLRHATSKIKTENDLNKIETLGFRGEALAAISSVAKVELITNAGADTGTHYEICGGEETENCETACPKGTTLIVRDLFYNTPARLKFLKKDSSEGTAVGATLERAALSHPEIAFKFIKDGKVIFSTVGDGNLAGVIYNVLGREFHNSLLPVKSAENGIEVNGFTCKPVYCRASSSHQYTFINGRLVISGTVKAAAEQAYKTSSMVGKFPAFVLCLKIPPETVDVNVHPAKTEVRFSDANRVFSAVYYAVRNALSSGDTRPEIKVNRENDKFLRLTAEEYRQTAVSFKETPAKIPAPTPKTLPPQRLEPFFMRQDVTEFSGNKKINVDICVDEPQKTEPEEKQAEYSPETEIKILGEAFSTYILAERGSELYLIDKHAAHERIIFNRLKKEQKCESQMLLTPVSVKLSSEEHSAVINNLELLFKAGFEIEDFGVGTVLVRAIPAALDGKDTEAVTVEAANSLCGGGKLQIDSLENIYHTVACKAAIKAGSKTTGAEAQKLAEEVLNDCEIMYCPHGRPVAFLIKRTELEKYFGRIQ